VRHRPAFSASVVPVPGPPGAGERVTLCGRPFPPDRHKPHNARFRLEQPSPSLKLSNKARRWPSSARVFRELLCQRGEEVKAETTFCSRLATALACLELSTTCQGGHIRSTRFCVGDWIASAEISAISSCYSTNGRPEGLRS
jgi:hypothetical protein